MIHGLWKVTGKRGYRGHMPGDEFEATLEEHSAGWAVRLGHISLLDQFEPSLPEEYALPEGWDAKARV